MVFRWYEINRCMMVGEEKREISCVEKNPGTDDWWWGGNAMSLSG